MTIDDELILELIKPNRLGEITKESLIAKVVGTSKAKYELETRIGIWGDWEQLTGKPLEMTPDIIITRLLENSQVAIELENDIQWDFANSLRQIKKYNEKFEDVRVIIPEDYRRFAPLYKNEGFRVYLWKAKRKWQCLRCGTITEKEGKIQPKCKNVKCKNKSRNEFTLVGLKDVDIEEYERSL